MNIKKPLLIAGIATTLGVAGIAGTSLVSAETASTGSDSLANKIAQKFNLNKDEVQAVFDEDRQAKEAERSAKIEKELSDAVSNGKLTSEQKDKILAKAKELKSQRDTERDSMKNKTEAERRTAMETKRTELEQWAKDNNIPTDYLKYVMGHGGHGPGGPGGPGGFGGSKQDSN